MSFNSRVVCILLDVSIKSWVAVTNVIFKKLNLKSVINGGYTVPQIFCRFFQVSIFLKDKVQNNNGRFVIPISGSVPNGFNVPGTVRLVSTC